MASMSSLPPTIPNVDVYIPEWLGTEQFYNCTVIANGVDGTIRCKLLRYDGLEPLEVDTLTEARVIEADGASIVIEGVSTQYLRDFGRKDAVVTWKLTASQPGQKIAEGEAVAS
jgi:hypothetical protein